MATHETDGPADEGLTAGVSSDEAVPEAALPDQASEVDAAARKEADRVQGERERALREAEKEATRAHREAEKAALEATLAQQRAARGVEKARREAARAGLAAAPDVDTEEPEGEPPLPRDLAVLWRTAEPPRRGPRPGLSLDRITTAAIEVADTEGLPSLSMARVAESLGVTTMALYRYVAGKDELLALMYDAALGTPPATDDSGGWRAALETWCRHQLRLAHVHPWIMQMTTVPPLGPNQVAWLEHGLAALAGTPLDEGDKARAIGSMALYVLSEGRVIAETEVMRRAAAASPPGDEASCAPTHPALLDYAGLLRRLTTPSSHPAISVTLEAGGLDDDPDDPYELGLGLDLVLDGVEALIARSEADSSGEAGGGS